MNRTSPLFVLAALAGAAVISACGASTKPPEGPEAPAASAEPEGEGRPSPSAEAQGDMGAMPGSLVKTVEPEKGQAIDTYEVTPSDCEALGKQYGAVQRADQMATLPAKLNEKQKAATVSQIDKVVSKLEEKWTSGCHASLENRAVDHASITCALAARTVKDFDVCINGEGGTPRDAGKPKKR